MRTMTMTMAVMSAVLMASAFVAIAGPAAKAPRPAEPAAYAEIKATFGMVPGFFKALPPESVDAIWADFKGLSLSETAIPSKYKDLISVAVASQIPCEYCVSADSQFARFDGAGDAELKESVLMSALTRKWSTVLNGTLQDDAEFRKEIDKGFAFAQKMAADKKMPPMVDVTDAASAMKDIGNTFGFVPSFLKHVPPSELAGAWLELKQVQFAPGTALPNKYKELIGLGVASQIPCKYCIYVHRTAARMWGASDAELDEAVAVAADTRHWSAILHGLQIDRKQFDRDVHDVLKLMAKQTKMASVAKP